MLVRPIPIGSTTTTRISASILAMFLSVSFGRVKENEPEWPNPSTNYTIVYNPVMAVCQEKEVKKAYAGCSRESGFRNS